MVGHIGAEATAAIGIVSSSTWLLHGILVGLYTAFSIQIAQYLGADRQQDARGVLRQAMLFNLMLGLGAAVFGVGISEQRARIGEQHFAGVAVFVDHAHPQ